MNQETDTCAQTVAFIGVGRMGSAMLKCVLDAGYAVTVYDPAASATDPFVASHPDRVRVATSARAAATAADIIEVVVNSDQQLMAACTGPDGALAGARRGSILLVHSTVAHSTLAQLSAAASEQGVRLLDAMVSGALGHMSAGDLAVLVGGDAVAFCAAKPLMSSYGSLVLHLGARGAGLDAKLALNLLRYMCMVAGQEATRLAHSAGVSDVMAQLVAHTQANRFVGDISKLVPYTLEQRKKEAATSTKDVRAAIERAEQLGLRLPGAERTAELLERLWGADTE